jgi:peptidoglycan/LPS O-acetylase OafA/YrhL
LPPVCVVALLVAEYWVQSLYPGKIVGVGAAARGVCGFALGMLLWRAAKERTAGAAAATVAEMAGLAGVGISVVLSLPSLIPPCGALLLYGLSFDRGWVARALRAKWCVWLGRISFSIYLVHYPLWVGAGYFLPAAWFGGPAGQWARMMLLLAILLPLCTLTWTVIEEPGRKLPDLFRPRRRWALASAAE